ncbi:Peptidase family M28 [Pedobacter steynii]|uniref:Peptidase family M28 n=1 Tax=Pedobacter steynii TaxID=430522 RepID=A0A1H0EHY4_9SPHI|nr:M20/M25/M40 family metallo-hydrolase [Pedobacter steynii]NQX42023.1 M20/M25/M40 family metallo-hydrolase [Pedobacter steynii]SDN82064.1 Peptidase family M28 [Pedobacter steynii]
MKKTIYTLFALFLAQQTWAQDIDKIITKPYVDRLIKTLSSDEMQGRATFSPGIDKAASFIEAEFKSIGLKPFEGKTFRQSFFQQKLKPISTKVTIDGKEIAASNVLVYGNTVESLVFDKASSAGWAKLDPEKPLMGQIRSLSKENKKQLILVDPKFAESFNRVRDYLAGGTDLDEKKINEPSAALVLVMGEETVTNDFKVEVKSKLEKLSLFNVAGVIPGKSKAKELVVFSGHYDHLGIIKSDGQDSIANGADDDASGTTAMIALAKYYKKLNNNERTLIFVAFTAEEIGGFGAKHFSQKLNPDEVVAMFNIEMIGKDSKFGKNTAFITGFDKSDFGKILQKNLEGTEFTFHPDPYPQQNLFYRSDNATLAALGVPAHTISTDQIDSDKFYHTVKDEYETLDSDNILSTIKGIAKSAISIIKGIDTPTRIPKLSN